MQIPKLKFPKWTDLKKLETTEDIQEEYKFEIFGFDSLNISGVLSVFEDNYPNIRFEVLENGYSGMNDFEYCEDFTPTGYKLIREEAQFCYTKLITEFTSNRSIDWQYYLDKSIQEVAESKEELKQLYKTWEQEDKQKTQ